MKDTIKKIGLQYFTDVINKTTDDNLSAEMKTFYEMQLIEEASPNLVFDQFAVTKDIPANGGKTIEFRKYDPLPEIDFALAEGVTPDGQSLTVRTITATVGQYGNYLKLTDMLIMTAIDNNIVQATKLLADQAALVSDKITRNALIEATNVGYADGATARVGLGSDTNKTYKLTVTDIYDQVNELERVNAPKINGMYACICHPDVIHDLMLSSDWKEMHKYAKPEEFFKGYVGEVAGCRFYVSTNAAIIVGKNLLGDTRKLTVDTTSQVAASATTIPVTNTLTADALIGRYVIIGGVKYKVTDNGTSNITIDTGLASAIAQGATEYVYPGEGGAKGKAVYACEFIGSGAYATTKLSNGGLEHIVKQLGYNDELNQRSSVGWKMTKTAEVLIPSYVRRFECLSYKSDSITEGNY